MESLFHFCGDYPTWYPKENRLPRPNRGRIVVTDFTKAAKQVIEPKLEEWLPGYAEGRFKKEKNSQGAVCRVLHPDGSFFDILTHNQPTKDHEGWSGSWVHFDEPPPWDKFIASKRGLVDFNGICYLTFTLLDEPWIVSDLYEPWYKGKDKNISFHFMSMDDNAIENGGYLPKEAIEEFCKYLDDDQLEVRRHGRFGSLEGRIYKLFRPLVHCLDSIRPETIPQEWTRYMVMDPHDHKPYFLGWFAVSPPDPVSFIVWYREAVLDMTIGEIAEWIITEEARYSEEVYCRIIDPNSGNTATKQTGLTLRDYFAQEHSLYFEDGVDDIETGHDRCRQLLYFNPELPVGPRNCPVVYLASDLTNMIKSIERYSTRRSSEGKVVLDPKWKDMCDVFRYGMMGNPVFVPRRDERVVPMPRGRRHIEQRFFRP